MTGYSPAETVERSGFSIETLRYYERIGLLTDIDRDTAGRRLFSEDDLREHDQAVAAKIERLQAQQRHLHEKITHYAERAAAVPAR